MKRKAPEKKNKTLQSNTFLPGLSKLKPNEVIDRLLGGEDCILNRPDDENWRHNLRYSILEYAYREDTLNLKLFCFEYGISYYAILTWMGKYPDLKQTWNLAKLLIGQKRQLRSERKELDGNLIGKSLYKYDPEWDEIDKRNAELKNIDDLVRAAMTVVYAPRPAVKSQEDLRKEVTKIHEIPE